MTRKTLVPFFLLAPPFLILLSLTAAGSPPRPWGALEAPKPACPASARVSSTAAALDARQALDEALTVRGRALSGGSAYAAAKIGLAPGSADWAAAEAAQAAVEAARAELARACGL